MKNQKYDFSGWATKANIKCSDGKIIHSNAFVEDNAKRVPVVWNHNHSDPTHILGYADLEHRDEGVYARASFNDTEQGRTAKELVKHGSIQSLSIYANRLQTNGNVVMHGQIREVSLVIAGANPKAFIDDIMMHSDGTIDQIIWFENEANITHGDDDEGEEEMNDPKSVLKTLNPEQYDAVAAVLGNVVDEYENKLDELEDEIENLEQTLEEIEDELDGDVNEEDYEEDVEHSDGGGMSMKHNAFEQDEVYEGNSLSHSEIKSIFEKAKNAGSLKDTVIAHGIDQIDYLFPDAKTLNNEIQLITRKMPWVSAVMQGVRRSPYSRVRTIFADLTEDEARAKGYIKGNLKKEQVFSLLKRETQPTTVYKKQKIHRDDLVDIVDFDIVALIRQEMRFMLDEEIARAILIGDGRTADNDDKINEQYIRPIWTDQELFVVNQVYSLPAKPTYEDEGRSFIRNAVMARINYRGSGNPVCFMPESLLTKCLLMEDNMGRVIYDSIAKLKLALRVSEIHTLEQFEGLTRTVDGKVHTLQSIIVNLMDYNVGADKGGKVSLFDDFDIDYNQQKYLIETRCSGALVKPFSAIVIEHDDVIAG